MPRHPSPSLAAPILFACGLAAACAGEADPILDLRAADGAALAAKASTGIYGKLWADPELAPLRAKLDEALAEAKAKAVQAGEPWLDPFATFQAARSVRVVVWGFGAAGPQLTAQADFGAQAEAVMAALAATGGAAADAAGADAAWRSADGSTVVARFGTNLVAALGRPPQPLPAAAPPERDLVGTVSIAAIARDLGALAAAPGIPKRDAAAMAALLPLIGKLGTAIAGSQELIPTGIRVAWTWDLRQPWMLPVDRGLLDRLDGNALMLNAIGIDGASLWKDVGEAIVASIAAQRGAAPEAVLADADKAIAGLGVDATLAELIAEVRGTLLLQVANGAPFPTVTVSAPTGGKLDALIAAALTRNQQQVPAVGGSAALTLPGVPIMITLMREQGRWTVSSDPLLAGRWLGGGAGSFAGSAAAAKLDEGGAQTVAYSWTDTPALLRLIQGYAGMAMGSLRDPALARSILALLNKASAQAAPSWSLTTATSAGIAHVGEMLTPYDGGGMALVPMIAAIAIPNLLESRVTANESAAMATLKAAVFPGQIQYQAGAYADQDGDQRGEYGFIDELSGASPTPGGGKGSKPLPGGHAAGSLTLLDSGMDGGGPVSGYRYIVYLPDGKGGAIADRSQPVDPAGIDAQEKFFVAYAWPAEPGDTGRRTFAITQDGRVVATTEHRGAEAPAWNACFAPGTSFADRKLAWPAASERRRGGGNRRAQRQEQQEQAKPADGAAPAPARDF